MEEGSGKRIGEVGDTAHQTSESAARLQSSGEIARYMVLLRWVKRTGLIVDMGVVRHYPMAIDDVLCAIPTSLQCLFGAVNNE